MPDKHQTVCGRMSYTKETYFLLNRFTLRIRDPEIEARFNKKRTEKFSTLFLPVLISVLLLTVERVTTYFLRKHENR